MVLSPELEYLAYTNESIVRKVNPLTKLIILLCLLTVNLTAGLYFELFLLLLVLIIFSASKVSFRAVKRPLIAAVSLSLIIFLAKLHYTKIGEAQRLFLDFYHAAAPLAAMSGLRIITGVISILIFVGTTPLYEVLSALSLIKMPRIVLEIFLIVYKYIFIINDEGIRTRNAQTVRLGYSSFRRSLESFGNLAGILILRSISKGESIIDALNVRGYRGDIFYPVKIKSLLFVDFLLIFMLGIVPLSLSLLWMR
ncbi:MAG: hypothetical protein OHK0040_06390 [bacterium]